MTASSPAIVAATDTCPPTETRLPSPFTTADVVVQIPHAYAASAASAPEKEARTCDGILLPQSRSYAIVCTRTTTT